MRLPGYQGRGEEDDDDEDDPNLEVEILAQDEDELDAETAEARESILEQLRELLDEYMQGVETAEETLEELRADLADWAAEDNPFDPVSMESLAATWHEATNAVRDGYSLIILGIERGQPEFFQAGYEMIEQGLFGRDDALND